MRLEVKLAVLLAVLLACLTAASYGLLACMDDEQCNRFIPGQGTAGMESGR